MAWRTTSDAAAFLAEVGDLLAQDRVAHAGLLSELGYAASRPDLVCDLGLWRDGRGSVSGAWVALPRHPVLVSRLAVDAMWAELPAEAAWEVDARDVVEAVARTGRREAGRLRLHVLAPDAVPDPSRVDPEGISRIATQADRPLLVRWYSSLLDGLEDDATDLAFLVDEPLSCGGAVLWERQGQPLGVAVVTRPVLGVVKVTAAWSPTDPAHAGAAFLAACSHARRTADVVVAVDRAGRPDPLLMTAGFRPQCERALLVAG